MPHVLQGFTAAIADHEVPHASPILGKPQVSYIRLILDLAEEFAP
jgi:hypothetical protein